MSHFNLDNFRSEVSSRGLARPSKFEVIITPPPAIAKLRKTGELVSLFCESTNIPGMNIATKAQRIYGPAYMRPISADYGGDGLTMVFTVDNKMEVKSFFDAWMNAVIDPTSFSVNYQSDYVTTVAISQLDNKNSETYTVYLEDAFPRSMNLMDLNMGSANQIHKLAVTFSYRRWRTLNEMSTSTQKDKPLKNPYRFNAGIVPPLK